MAAPVLDVRINFDRVGLNRISNDGFETNTTGWSVAAGIQGAGSSITRTTGGSPYMGLAVGRLVTTSTNGSGVKFVMSSTFTSGVTYRFRVALTAVSGATTCGIRIGSLGTAGDRAVSTFTVTATPTLYSVDVTPTGNRSDIQVNVYTNSAAAMTVDIDDAEVYATRDDLTASNAVDSATWNHGVNFAGGLLTGEATLHLTNMSQQYSTQGGATCVVPGLPLLIRSVYAGVPYGHFYGNVKRATTNVADRTIDVFATDPVDLWDRAAEIQFTPGATMRSYSSIRGLLLANPPISEPATRRNLAAGEAEGDIPTAWGISHGRLLDVLASFDTATGTVGFFAFNPSTSVLYVYTTIPRNALTSQTVDEVISDRFTAVTWDVNQDINVSAQRVVYNYPYIPDQWNTDLTAPMFGVGKISLGQYPLLPVDVANGQVITIQFDHSPGWFQTPVIQDDGPGQIDWSSAGSYSAETFTITGGGLVAGASVLSNIEVFGIPILYLSGSILETSVLSNGWTVQAPDINANPAVSLTASDALAYWKAHRYTGAFVPRMTLTVENLFPTQAVRNVADLIQVVVGLADAATYNMIIRSLSTTVTQAGLDWVTTYELDPAGLPASGTTFLLDTSTLNSAQILGY